MDSFVIDELLTTGCNICNCILGDNILSIELDKALRAETFEQIHDLMIVIFGWSSILISEFGNERDHWVVLTEFKPLTSIDVVKVTSNRLTLEGRGPDGKGWLKYEITGCKYKIISRQHPD